MIEGGYKNVLGFLSFYREQQQHIIMDCQAFVNTNVNYLNVIIAAGL